MTSRVAKKGRSLRIPLLTAVCTLIGCSGTLAETAVRIDGASPAYYPSLQAAIDTSRQGDVIQSLATSFNEHLIYSRDSTVMLDGGYGPGFGSRTGVSVVRGDLKVGAGKVTVRNYSIAPDITAPVVVAVSPREGLLGVPVNCVISVTFNETIRASSIPSGIITVKESGNKAVPGTVSASGRTLFFTPLSNLNTSMPYLVTVAPGVRDLAGNATTTGHSWQFETTFQPGAFDFSITPASARFDTWREELNGMVLDLKVTSSTPFPVMLTIEGCPPAAVCMASPDNVFNFPASVQQYVSLLVAAAPETPRGSFPVTIRGDGGGVYRSATVTVIVNPFRGRTRPTEVWGAGGTPVATAVGHQLGAVATGDGAGGAIFLWEDSRGTVGIPDIYGQRLSRGGTPLWQSDGIPLVTAVHDIWNDPAYQQNIAAIPDGAGGALFTWEDDRHLQGDIFGHRVNGSGITPWQQDGIPVCTACWTVPVDPCANYKSEPQIAPDNVGGAIISWHESRDGFHGSVWAQRVTATGTPAWQKDGVPVAYGDFSARYARIVSDGAGGAIIVWQDYRNSTLRYRAQRLDASGAPLWPVNGLEVPGAPPAVQGIAGFETIADGAGGVIIVWVGAAGDNTSDIHAQRLDPAGNALWGPGVSVCSRQSFQYSPAVTADGTGGAIIAWEDLGASAPGSGQQWIYSQRLDAQGAVLWQADGIPLYTVHGSGPRAAGDGAGGAIIVWDGFRLAGPNQLNPAIYAQHLTGDGQMLWNPSGFEVFSLQGNYGMGPRIISDGVGGAIIHWTDYRLTSGQSWDIFSQRLTDKVP